MTKFNSDFFVSDNIKIHYESAGTGPLMVFLHGFPEFWYQWRHQLQEFSKSHFVVAPDLRGFNLSSKPKELENYNAEKIINDLKSLCDHLGYKKMILVAHDWGGILAWVFAYYYPQYLDKLIILNAPHPAIFERELHTNPLQQKASEYILLLRNKDAENKLKENEFEWLQDIVLTRGLKKEKLTKKDKEAYLSAWSKEDALLGMLSYYKNSTLIMENDLPLWGTFKLLPGIDANKITVDVPTLVIWGELDFALRIENLNGLEEFVPNLKIERLPRATHWLLQEQEEKINKIINEYISN